MWQEPPIGEGAAYLGSCDILAFVLFAGIVSEYSGREDICLSIREVADASETAGVCECFREESDEDYADGDGEEAFELNMC